jgi:hypothetical protein
MLRSWRYTVLSIFFLTSGAVAGGLFPAAPAHANGGGGQRCWDSHYCYEGSSGSCSETPLYRWCEYSPSGACVHWYGECPYNR